MKVNNQEVYDKWKKEQQADGFPAIWILRAMEKFADAIENDIKCMSFLDAYNKNIHGIKEVDDLSGSMVDAMINFLIVYWYYGEELRVTWNTEYNYTGEGFKSCCISTITARGK